MIKKVSFYEALTLPFYILRKRIDEETEDIIEDIINTQLKQGGNTKNGNN